MNLKYSLEWLNGYAEYSCSTMSEEDIYNVLLEVEEIEEAIIDVIDVDDAWFANIELNYFKKVVEPMLSKRLDELYA